MERTIKVIGSVQRAIDILNLFDDRNPELGSTEIAKLLGLHKSTASSLIRTLEVNGLLAQNASTRKYRLGFRLLERASSMLNHLPIRDVALPILQDLRDQVDETVNLGVLDGAQIVYIERLLGTKLLSIHSDVGRRASVYSTALGKAILSGLPLTQVRTFLHEREMKPVTPKTITDAEKLLRDLDKAREQGFALDDEENELGGRCVAAPIFDHAGNVVASVSVSAPTARLPMSDVPRVGAQVRQSAIAISRGLGYTPRAF